MPAKRFVIWAAVSSEEQAERYSLTEQRQLAEQHIVKWGGETVHTLEVGESRSIILLEDAAARIPAYAALRDLIAKRAFDVLICYDVTRLGRKRSLIAAIEELCADAGILIYELDSPPANLDDVAGFDKRLLSSIKGATAQDEVERMKKRMRFGREGRAKRGDMPQSPPYGYAWAWGENGERHIVIDEGCAAVVRDIIASYLNGRGVIGIAADLTARGVPTPAGGSTWQKNSALIILDRAWTYAGYAEYYRGKHPGSAASYIRTPGRFPAIIDAATAERVIAERETRAANRRVADTHSRLTGVVWCAVCQRPMWQVINEGGEIRDKDGTRRRAKFYCPNHHPGGSVSTALVLEAIGYAIADLLASDWRDLVDDSDDQAAQLRARIEQHAAEVRRLEAGLKRADDAYVNGMMDAERYRAQVDRLQQAIAAERSASERARAAIDAEAQRGNRADRLAEIAAQGRAMLTTPNTAAANAWLRRLVRVWVRDNSPVDVWLGW